MTTDEKLKELWRHAESGRLDNRDLLRFLDLLLFRIQMLETQVDQLFGRQRKAGD